MNRNLVSSSLLVALLLSGCTSEDVKSTGDLHTGKLAQPARYVRLNNKYDFIPDYTQAENLNGNISLLRVVPEYPTKDEFLGTLKISSMGAGINMQYSIVANADGRTVSNGSFATQTGTPQAPAETLVPLILYNTSNRMSAAADFSHGLGLKVFSNEEDFQPVGDGETFATPLFRSDDSLFVQRCIAIVRSIAPGPIFNTDRKDLIKLSAGGVLPTIDAYDMVVGQFFPSGDAYCGLSALVTSRNNGVGVELLHQKAPQVGDADGIADFVAEQALNNLFTTNWQFNAVNQKPKSSQSRSLDIAHIVGDRTGGNGRNYADLVTGGGIANTSEPSVLFVNKDDPNDSLPGTGINPANNFYRFHTVPIGNTTSDLANFEYGLAYKPTQRIFASKNFAPLNGATHVLEVNAKSTSALAAGACDLGLTLYRYNGVVSNMETFVNVSRRNIKGLGTGTGSDLTAELNGNCKPTNPNAQAIGLYASDVQMADLDNDGDMDLVVVGGHAPIAGTTTTAGQRTFENIGDADLDGTFNFKESDTMMPASFYASTLRASAVRTFPISDVSQNGGLDMMIAVAYDPTENADPKAYGRLASTGTWHEIPNIGMNGARFTDFIAANISSDNSTDLLGVGGFGGAGATKNVICTSNAAADFTALQLTDQNLSAIDHFLNGQWATAKMLPIAIIRDINTQQIVPNPACSPWVPGQIQNCKNNFNLGPWGLLGMVAVAPNLTGWGTMYGPTQYNVSIFTNE